MKLTLDEIDRKILDELQIDGTLSVDSLSERAHLSRNACWRRVKRMEDAGIIKARVALIDAEMAGCGLSVFILVRTSSHDPDWLGKFRSAMARFPEIVGVYRMTGAISTMCSKRAFPTSKPMTASISD